MRNCLPFSTEEKTWLRGRSRPKKEQAFSRLLLSARRNVQFVELLNCLECFSAFLVLPAVPELTSFMSKYILTNFSLKISTMVDYHVAQRQLKAVGQTLLLALLEHCNLIREIIKGPSIKDVRKNLPFFDPSSPLVRGCPKSLIPPPPGRPHLNIYLQFQPQF